jgi:hypothetical protein
MKYGNTSVVLENAEVVFADQEVGAVEFFIWGGRTAGHGCC